MRRRVGFLFICSAAIPIAIFASAAWACGALTTLKSSPSVAAPNGTITVTGRNFGCAPTPGAPCVNGQGQPITTYTPVQIRWNSRTGDILKQISPPPAGSFETTVNVPASASPGWFVVNATQFRIDNGSSKSGSPGRTTVRVQGAGASSTTPWGAAKPTGGPGSPYLPLPGILLSVALLATGLALVARDKGKKATRPVLGA